MLAFKEVDESPKSRTQKTTSALFLSLLFFACGSPQEPVRVEIPVLVDATKIKQVRTDLGYEVELHEAKLMVKDFTFAVAGEAHVSFLRRSYQWLIPDAVAHPGHYLGGDITGELSGRFLLNWLPGADARLGQASLLVGKYSSANFELIRASASDLPDNNDPLLDHTSILRGKATRNGEEISFSAFIDSPEDRLLEGVPFEFELMETSNVEIHVQLELLDALEGDTLFDGLDFSALDEDSDGELTLAANSSSEALIEAYNLLRRTLQTHDHFELKAVPVTTSDSIK